MSDQFLYHRIDPHDFRVGHRYHRAPGEEHEYTVCEVRLVGDRIVVTTFNGRHTSYPERGPVFVTCDEQGC